jgi:hypothetical protein
MPVIPPPEPAPTGEPADVPAAAPGLGVPTLDDLSNRADKAFTEHLEGYTASTVLHRLYLAEVFGDENGDSDGDENGEGDEDGACGDDGDDDEDIDGCDALRGALDLVFSRLATHHTATRAAWRRAYDAWAAAAGVAPMPDDNAAGDRVGEPAEPPAGEPPVYDDMEELFADLIDEDGYGDF